ncbi:MAG: heme biosynthesis protein HemY [Hyphomicrobiaceae bacterium]|nr:heme biosynthesis protein HemY [Hyphomicrobiaceae bacterium]
MLRLVAFLLAVVALATGLSWLADRPGLIAFNWEGYEGEITVFHAVVGLTLLIGLAILTWSVLRSIWMSPAAMGRLINRRRQTRGLDALSSGMIAIGAGDKSTATRYAIQARKSLPNEPLTHLLRAQAAQLSGDKATSRRIFEAMLASPDTEQLGLRGLFLEAEREGERVAALQFAERALKLNPKLGWSADALFDLQCKSADWAGALQTLSLAKKHGHVDKALAERRRAVLLTAQAQNAEDSDPERALSLALEAHNLAPGLVPAAAIAGRILASRGNTPKAAKVIQRTWVKSPHPDLATAYAFARLGDSPRDRLERVKQLARLTSNSIESPIAVARAAIESHDFESARAALEPLLEGRMTQRVATLMARIEGEEHGDKGRVREWLARAVNAPRDPVWTADGIVAETWAPISPVSGQLDAFQWRVPVESMEKPGGDLLAQKLEELVALGAPLETVDAKTVDAKTIDAAATTEVRTTPDAAAAAEAAIAAATVATAATTAEATTVEAAVATPAPVQKSAATAEPKGIAPAARTPEKAPQRRTTAIDEASLVTPPVEAAPAVANVAAAQSANAASAPVAEPSAAAAETKALVAVETPKPAKRAVTTSAKGAAVVAPPPASTTNGASARSASSPQGAGERGDAVAATGAPSGKRSTSLDGDLQRANTPEAQIFVSPRAPDDPGTEDDTLDAEPISAPRRSFANR